MGAGDLENYQTALEEVLTWLLSAEDALQAQGDISNDVEVVKEQFHTHEVYVYTNLLKCIYFILFSLLVFWGFVLFFINFDLENVDWRLCPRVIVLFRLEKTLKIFKPNH